MDTKRTGELIAEARKEKNMTQRQLAEALHVSDRTVSKWERGAGFPDVALLEPLADALELSVTELLRGGRQEKPDADSEVRYALNIVRQRRREKLKKNFRDIISALVCLAVLGFFAFHFAEQQGAFSEDIYLELDAGVYIDGVRVEDTHVLIDGSKNNLRSEFFGRLAIEYIEKTCRDEVRASVSWRDEGQSILYGGYGSVGIVELDRYCYFSSNMMGFAIENKNEGWIIATDDYLAELMALDGYYPLLEAGHHYYFN